MRLKYAVIGTGAIGGYYGGMLARNGNEVHFLFHSDYDWVQANGLQINSIGGDFHLDSVNAYQKTGDMPRCDVILICLKSTNNYLLKELLPPLLHKDTLVLLIQNGLDIEKDLQPDFPDMQIAGGLAFICSHKTGPGFITHLDYGRLTIGSYSCKNDQVIQQICADFTSSGIETVTAGLQKARWMKLVWNIPYNGLTVLLNTTTDKLMNSDPGVSLIRDLMLEVIRGGNAAGNGLYEIDESYADKMLEMTRSMTPYSPSMKLDFDHKRPLEVNYIYSRPIQKAAQAGYHMSKTGMLEKALLFIENNYL